MVQQDDDPVDALIEEQRRALEEARYPFEDYDADRAFWEDYRRALAEEARPHFEEETAEHALHKMEKAALVKDGAADGDDLDQPKRHR